MMQYTSIKVVNNLVKLIEESEGYTSYGYRSISEFIIEATRLHLRRFLNEDKNK